MSTDTTQDAREGKVMASISEFLHEWRGFLEALALAILLAVFSMYTRELKYSIAEGRREDLAILKNDMEKYADTKSVVAAEVLVLKANMVNIQTRLDEIRRGVDALQRNQRKMED